MRFQRGLKKVLSLTVIAGLLFSLSVGPKIAGAREKHAKAVNSTAYDRLAGDNRYQTARKIAERAYSATVATVILASGNRFTDALAAAVLAYKLKAPILLIDSTVDGSGEALEYIKNHLDKNGNVIMVGEASLSKEAFSAKLGEMGYTQVQSLGGEDPYETAAVVMGEIQAPVKTPLVVSSGEDFPDAMAISGFAARLGYPILLTRHDSLPEHVAALIQADDPGQIYITGGTGAVSEIVEAKIKEMAPNAEIIRLAGRNRFETAVKIIETFEPSPQIIYLVSGYSFADALAGSVLAAQTDALILPVDPGSSSLPSSVMDYLNSLHAPNIDPDLVVLGGTRVVPESTVAAALKILYPPPSRLYGQTRFDTAKAIAEYVQRGSVQSVILASGNGYADALAASVLAKRFAAPILLTDATAAASTAALIYVAEHLEKNGTIYIAGGTGVVGTDIETALRNQGYKNIQRLGGQDRYETDLMIVNVLAAKPGTPVVISSGENYPDALSISGFAAYNGWPILLVPQGSLPTATAGFIKAIQPSKVYITGGPGVVSLKTQAEIEELVPAADIRRLAGLDRYETAAQILKEFAAKPQTLYLTSGNDFADALSGSALAARNGDPIVLVDPGLIDLPTAIEDYAATLAAGKVVPEIISLGGPHVVTEWVVESMNAALAGSVSPQLAWLRAQKDSDFVDLSRYIPGIETDIRYATTNNFMHAKVYDSPNAYLRKGTADKLKAVAEEIADLGYHIKIWDAYRPPSVQFKMWDLVHNANYVANPYNGYSNHSRGMAVDLTLVDRNGQELAMPSAFDDFSLRADRNYDDVSSAQADNARYLEDLMKRHGFKPLTTEWWHFDDTTSYDVAQSANISQPPSPRAIIHETLTLSAIGDNTLGTDPSWAYAGSFPEAYDRYGASYFFANVVGVLDKDDLTIANLETTFTKASAKVDKSFQDAAYWFKGDPSYTQILKAGSIEAVNVANNHSMDFETQGFNDTVKALNQAGIYYFGYGHEAIVEKKGVKIGLLGYNALGPVEEGVDLTAFKKEIASEIAKLKQSAQLVVVSFHWGRENSYQQNASQIDLGHFAIDQGADLVLGHHPHVIEPVEEYKGKYIVYSLGNFSFGGNRNPGDKDTFIFRQSFDVVNGEIWRAYKPEAIPASVSSSTNFNDYRPTIVSGSAAQRVLGKVKMP